MRPLCGVLFVIFLGLLACAGPEPDGATLSEEFWPTELYSGEAEPAKRVVLDS